VLTGLSTITLCGRGRILQAPIVDVTLNLLLFKALGDGYRRGTHRALGGEILDTSRLQRFGGTFSGAPPVTLSVTVILRGHIERQPAPRRGGRDRASGREARHDTRVVRGGKHGHATRRSYTPDVNRRLHNGGGRTVNRVVCYAGRDAPGLANWLSAPRRHTSHEGAVRAE
jgi:hypothetical protein